MKRAALYARVLRTMAIRTPRCSLPNCGILPAQGLGSIRGVRRQRVSGAKERRPQLDRLLVDAGAEPLMLSWSIAMTALLDHWTARECPEEFRSLGIDLISLHEGVIPRRKRPACVRDLRQHRRVERELIRDG